MYKYQRGNLKKLRGNDRERMGRLFEEITGNVQEMSAMMSRLHGNSVNWGKFVISPHNNSADDGPTVLISVCNPETGECGCYDHEAGTCGPCPEIDV